MGIIGGAVGVGLGLQRIAVMKNGRLSFKQPRPGQAARVQADRTGGSASTGTPADLQPPLDSDSDSELPDFDDPDSGPADTITFD